MSDVYTELLDKLTLDDILPEFADIAECVGVDAYIRLIKLCGGSTISIPTINTTIRYIRNRQIAADFNGYNVRVLGTKYGLSDSTVYEILRLNNASIGLRGPKLKNK